MLPTPVSISVAETSSENHGASESEQQASTVAAEVDELFSSARQLQQYAQSLEDAGEEEEAMEVHMAARQRYEELQRLSPNHPEMVFIDAQLVSLRRRIGELIETRFEARMGDAEACVAEAAEYEQMGEFERAKDAYVEAADIFMELEELAVDRGDKAQIGTRVIEILNRAEAMQDMQVKMAQSSIARRRRATSIGPLADGLLSRQDSVFSGHSSEGAFGHSPSARSTTLEDAMAQMRSPTASPTPLSRLVPDGARPRRNTFAFGSNTSLEVKSVPSREDVATVDTQSSQASEDGESRDRSGTVSQEVANAFKRASLKRQKSIQRSMKRGTRKSSTSSNPDSVPGLAPAGVASTARSASAIDEGDEPEQDPFDDGVSEHDVKAVQTTVRELTGEPFDFTKTTRLIIRESDRVDKCQPHIKGELLPMLAHVIPSVGATSPLKCFQINSAQLDAMMALEQGLAESLLQLPKLTIVNLAYCDIDARGCALLCQSLAKSETLVSLNLSFNPIGDEGVVAIADPLLKTSRTIGQLVLEACNISPTGGAMLQEAIATQTSLRTLNLHGNNIGCDVVNSFILGVKHVKTHISTNHTAGKGSAALPCRQKHALPQPHIEMSEFRPVEGRVRSASPMHDSKRWGGRLMSLRRKDKGKDSAFASSVHGAKLGIASETRYFRAETLIRHFRKDFASARQKASNFTTVMMLGQPSVGRTSLMSALLGQDAMKRAVRSKGKANQFENKDRRFAVWDFQALDGGGGDEPSVLKELGSVLARIANEADASIHVHCLWFVMGSPVLQECDAKYLRAILQNLSLPVVVVINKADQIDDEQLSSLKKDIDYSCGSYSRFKGCFTCVADTSAVEESVKQQLARAGSSSLKGDSDVAQYVGKVISSKHQLKQAVEASQQCLPDAIKQSFIAAKKKGLQMMEMTASDVAGAMRAKLTMDSTQSRIKSALGGRGKKWLCKELGRTFQRVGAAFRFHSQDPLMADANALGSRLFDMLEAAEANRLTANGTADPDVCGAIGVLMVLAFKRQTLTFIHEACSSAQTEPGDILSRVVKRFETYVPHLGTVANYMEQVDSDKGQNRSANASPNPAAQDGKASPVVGGGTLSAPLVFSFVLEKAESQMISELSDERRLNDALAAPQISIAVPEAIQDSDDDGRSVLDHAVSLIIRPDMDLGLRKSLMASYRSLLKSQPEQLIAALASRFKAHVYSNNAMSRRICSVVVLFCVEWMQAYFASDFEGDDSDTHAVLSALVATQADRAQLLQKAKSLSKPLDAMVSFAAFIRTSPCSSLAISLESGCEKAISAHVADTPRMAFGSTIFNPLAHFSSRTIAAHIAFYDHTMFRSMTMRDFYESESEVRTKLIRHASQLSFWVVRSVVEVSDLDDRVEVLATLLRVADDLQSRRFRDLHGFMAVITALQMCHVSRLKKTWAAFQQDHVGLYRKFTDIMAPLADPGNGMYTTALDRANEFASDGSGLAGVPFLGSFLTAVDRAKARGKSKTTDSNLEQAQATVDIATTIGKTLSCVPALQQGRISWSKYRMDDSLYRFLSQELHHLFDLSSNASRNKVEDLLNLLSQQREPRNEDEPAPPIPASKAAELCTCLGISDDALAGIQVEGDDCDGADLMGGPSSPKRTSASSTGSLDSIASSSSLTRNMRRKRRSSETVALVAAQFQQRHAMQALAEEPDEASASDKGGASNRSSSVGPSHQPSNVADKLDASTSSSQSAPTSPHARPRRQRARTNEGASLESDV